MVLCVSPTSYKYRDAPINHEDSDGDDEMGSFVTATTMCPERLRIRVYLKSPFKACFWWNKTFGRANALKRMAVHRAMQSDPCTSWSKALKAHRLNFLSTNILFEVVYTYWRVGESVGNTNAICKLGVCMS